MFAGYRIASPATKSTCATYRVLGRSHQHVLRRAPPQLRATFAAGTQCDASPTWHCHCYKSGSSRPHLACAPLVSSWLFFYILSVYYVDATSNCIYQCLQPLILSIYYIDATSKLHIPISAGSFNLCASPELEVGAETVNQLLKADGDLLTLIYLVTI
jgi:hypothetical protein